MRSFLFALPLAAVSLPLYSQSATELGSEGDLVVLGTGGTALDPNVKIKGFTVFGSTQAAYTGAVTGNGNVVVNGVLAVSSGTYFVGNSTFTGADKIFVNDGSPGQILGKNTGGWLEWFNAGAIGDDLGDHTAVQDLLMAGFSIVNAASGTFTQGITASSFTAAGVGLMAAQLRLNPANNLVISSETSAALGAGVRVSTNIYIVGFSSAAKYYGDGASLTGVASAEALGSKIGGSGTADWVAKFQGSGNAITDSSIYDNGTVTVLTNPSSVTVYGKDAASGYSLALSSGINMPNGTVNAGQVWFNPNIAVSSEPAAAYGGGVRISTNVYIVGFSSAAKYYGDGSSLTGIAGDNLGNHTGTQVLQMGAYGVNTSSNITAARYQINGSTVLAILQGISSIGVGVGAGRANTGNYNVFVGSSAGYFNTTGAGNSFLGYNAGYNNTAGRNSFVGYYAGYNNTTAQWNSFMGAWAGYSNTTGEGNSFVGYSAGESNTTGANNTFMGSLAGDSSQVGSANTIIGNEAGYGVPNNSFSSSTIVGHQAGFGMTTGSDNILLGFKAGYAVTTGAGNIIIGYNKDASAPEASNELNIGGLLYGNLSAKTIGISTRVPQAALDIVSTGTLISQYAQIWRASDGTIVSSMTATGVLYPQSVPVGDNLGNHNATQRLNMAGNQIIGVSSLTVIAPDTIASSLWVSTSAATPHLYVSTNGNVGIGTTGPRDKLELSNSAINGYPSLQFSGGTTATVGSFSSGRIISGFTSDIYPGAYLDLQYPTAANTFTTGLRLINGNVGIGMEPVGAKLAIQGDGSSSGSANVTVKTSGGTFGPGLTLNHTGAGGRSWLMTTPGSGNCSGAAGRFELYDGTLGGCGAAQRMVIDANGNVGIGAVSPSVGLHILKAQDVPLRIETSGTNAPGLDLWWGGARKGTFGVAQLANSFVTGAAANDFIFRPDGGGNFIFANAAANSQLFKILNSGNVGIGSAAPSYRLVVSSGAGEAGTIMAVSTGTSNLFWVAGDGAHAVKFFGDGSQLTNLTGAADNLGNHVATTTLNMAGFQIKNVSSMTVIAPDTIASSLWVSTSATTPHLYVSINGNIGIGTSDASDLLTLSGTSAGANIISNNNAYLYLDSGKGGTAGNQVSFIDLLLNGVLKGNIAVNETTSGMPFEINSAVAGNVSLASGGGNVGIGTKAPGNKLHISADAAGTWPADPGSGQLVLRGVTNTNKALGFMIDTTENVGKIQAQLIGTGAYNLALQPAGGNVGIGNTNPGTRKLKVSGDAEVTGNWYWLPAQNFRLDGSANNQEWSFDLTNQGTYTGNYWQVWSDTKGTILAARGDSGNVGIGTAAPSYRLEVSSGAGEAGTILAVSTGTSMMIELQGDGDVIAKRFIGDGSQLTGITGAADNLGNHVATTTLNMANFGVVNVASITVTNFIRTSTLTVIAPDTLASSLWVSTSAATPHLYVSTNGNIGIGTNAPGNHLEIWGNAAAGRGPAIVQRIASFSSTYTDWQGHPTLILSKSHNNTLGSYSTTLNNEQLGAIEFSGVDSGNSSMTGGKIYVQQAGAAGSGSWNTPSDMIFNLGTTAGPITPLFLRNTGSVGIMTITPTGLFQVGGGSLTVLSSGNVGIGTTGPSYPLTVHNVLASYGTEAFVGWNDRSLAGETQTDADRWGWYATGGTTHLWDNANSANRMSIANTGNVGIGTTTPGYRLVVSSGAGEAGTILAVSTGTSTMIELQGDGDVIAKRFIGDGSQLTNLTGAADNLGNHTATATLNMASFNLVNVSSVNYLPNVFISSATAAQGGGIYVSSNVYIVGFSSAAKYYGDGSALTGIGGGSSGPSIDVSTINATATTTYGGVNITTNVFVNGNLGIGTTAPGGKLHIAQDAGDNVVIRDGSSGGSGSQAYTLYRKARTGLANPTAVSAGDQIGSIHFQAYNDAYRNAAQIKAVVDTGVGATGADMPGLLSFWTSPDGSATVQERMRIDNQGNVGIGTTNPSAGFQVEKYAAGAYTAYISTSSTAGQYSIAVSSAGITNINNLVIENRTSDPASPVTGQIWLRVD